jgi:hypothetical protein
MALFDHAISKLRFYRFINHFFKVIPMTFKQKV